MDVLNLSELYEKFDEIIDRVVTHHARALITRKKADAVVLVSLADWTEMQETQRLLSSSRNVARLADGIAQLDSGGGSERDPIEP